MDQNLKYSALAISLLVSLILVSIVRSLSFRLGYVVAPRKDRWHQRPIPTLGGVGIFVAYVLTVLLVGRWLGVYGYIRWSLLAGSLLMFGLGLVDDLAHLTPATKLVIQILAAAVVIFYGRVINFFPWEIANVLLTFIWLVGITNAINLLDNMDGLAAGIACIAAAFLSYFFWRADNTALLLLSLSLAGSTLGFLVFNFPPARIFMGDSGSLFIGFTLAALAVAHRPQASDVFSVMGVPILLFLLPIVDTTLVTITRLLRGQSPVRGGTDHTSHRLIAFGLSERQVVLFLYGVGVLSGIAGVMLEALNYELSLVLIPVLLIALSLITAYLGRLKVVVSNAPASSGITRLMVELTYRRRLFEIILDFFLIGVSYYLAFWTHRGLQLTDREIRLFLRTFPIALVGSYISFSIFEVYRFFWRYIGVEDLLLFARAIIGAIFLTAIPVLALYSRNEYSPVIFFLFGVFLFLGLLVSRSSFRILDRIHGSQQNRAGKINVLICGAEDAGEIALRWILLNPSFGYWPVGFVDDDPLKWGRRIQGVSVLGGTNQLEMILKHTQADGLILTSLAPDGNGATSELLETCKRKGVWVKVLRLNFDPLE